MAIKILRGGASTRFWSYEARTVRVLKSQADGFVGLRFTIPSKGGGDTGLRLEIYPDSFEALADAMWAIDENAAIRAFGKALSVGHSTDQPEV